MILQPGAIVTFTVNAMIEATAAGTLTNRAQVNAPSGVCVSGCTQDSTASVRSNRADPYLIPANNPLALLGLALLMMLGAGFGLRQSRR